MVKNIKNKEIRGKDRQPKCFFSKIIFHHMIEN